MPAVAYGSLSQSCQWLSPVMQTKSIEVHFSRGTVLASVAASDKTPALPSNMIIQRIEIKMN